MQFKTILMVFLAIFTTQLSAQWMYQNSNYQDDNNQGHFITVDQSGSGYSNFNTIGHYFNTDFGLIDSDMSKAGNAVNGLGWRYGLENNYIHYKLKGFWMDTNPEVTGTGGKVIAGAYGWVTNEDRTVSAEYYIVERWAVRENPGNQDLPHLVGSPNWPDGSSSVDYCGTYDDAYGDTYNVYRTYRNQKPGVLGTGNYDFYQYWAIRQNQREVSETAVYKVDVGSAFAAWRSNWSDLPYWHDYQVMKIEGWNSKGGGAFLVPHSPSSSASRAAFTGASNSSATIKDPIAISIAPNPGSVVESTVTVKLEKEGPINLSVYSAEGRQVGTAIRNGFAGTNQIKLSNIVPDKLVPGVYMVRADSGAESKVQRLVIR